MSVVFEGVKVKKEIVVLVKELVKNGFYRADVISKVENIKKLSKTISEIYSVSEPIVKLGSTNCYIPIKEEINIENPSIISFLHEYRHHLQHKKGFRYEGLTIEQDARAWSLRIYSLACPKSFEKSVKEGKVCHIKWDERLNKVVDNCKYI